MMMQTLNRNPIKIEGLQHLKRPIQGVPKYRSPCGTGAYTQRWHQTTFKYIIRDLFCGSEFMWLFAKAAGITGLGLDDYFLKHNVL